MSPEVWEGPLPKKWSRHVPGHHYLIDNKKMYSPEYSSWFAMVWRCYSTNHPAYARYGGAGIRIQKSWINFSQFLLDMGPRPEGTSLNRKNHAKIYSKETCDWATWSEQSVETKLSKKNKSGYRGVSWYPSTNKWTVRVHIDGRPVNLGYFETKEEAALVYNSKALEVYGSKTQLNKVEKL